MLKSRENLRVQPLGMCFLQSSTLRSSSFKASAYASLCRALLPPKKAAQGSAEGTGLGVPQTGAPIGFRGM